MIKDNGSVEADTQGLAHIFDETNSEDRVNAIVRKRKMPIDIVRLKLE